MGDHSKWWKAGSPMIIDHLDEIGKAGQYVEFHGQGGYESEVREALRCGFKPGNTYEITTVEINSNSSYYEFAELTGEFNTAMFSVCEKPAAKKTGILQAMNVNSSDHFQTPDYALDPIKKFFKHPTMKMKLVWEPACGKGNIVRSMEDSDIRVWGSDVLGKPFALLMPTAAIEGKNRQALYNEHGMHMIIPDRRIAFETPTGKSGSKSSPQFLMLWYTWGLCNCTPGQITGEFVQLPKPSATPKKTQPVLEAA